ncbi:hypothetical protein [Agrobacterium cavarae]|uniref:hypothetical protein n=1 Tax=Agrobacterium cavarae TaxID=2528239 RepID=UPI0028AE92EA|nr:hypothetical protein [Agrobacterium cavarae]
MTHKKRLPEHLKSSSQRRTIDARQSVLRVLGEIDQELASGKLLERYIKNGPQSIAAELKHSSISVRAGLGPNFLNGPSHKESTKLEVEDFVRDRLAQLAAQAPEIKSEKQQIADLKDEVFRLESRCHRISDMAHLWAIQLREARAEIRALKKAMKPRLV